MQKMNRKSYEEKIIEPNPRVYAFRQPKGVDLHAVAAQHGFKISGLLRAALFEYMECHKPTRDEIDKMCA